MKQHGARKSKEFRNRRNYSHVYTAVMNTRKWKVSFKYEGQVRANYEDIKKYEENLREKYGDKLVHIWVYDRRLQHRWVGHMLTEMQLRAHFGIEIPARFLRGEASPRMTDYLNDRGGE